MSGPRHLPPGAVSALHHRHSVQDAFVLVPSGEPVLAIGDRQPGDALEHPRDDLQALRGADGRWRVAREDGTSH